MTENHETPNGLSENPMFREIPRAFLEKIARESETRVLPANTVIFRQGDSADGFYIILSGRVKIYHRTDKGLKIELNILEAGESFGEIALMSGNPRSESAVTLEETRLTVLTKETFEYILKNYPDVSLNFVRKISRWLSMNDQRLEKVIKRQFQERRPTILDFVILIGFSLLLAFTFNYLNPNGLKPIPDFWLEDQVPEIPTQPAMADYKQGKSLFVDARPTNFYEKDHIKGAINIPLSLFDIMYAMDIRAVDKAKDIIVYGRTVSSLYDEQVARELILRGHRNVKILEGGLSAWKEKGYPIEP